MRFLDRLFGQKDSEPSDDEINKLFVPIRNAICKFKDGTNISWTIILPAAQKESLRIILHSRGISGARAFFSKQQLRQYTNDRIPMSAIISSSIPHAPEEHKKAVSDMMSEISAIMIEEGARPDNVAQALSAFALMVAENVADKMYASSILKATYDELDSIEGVSVRR